MITSTNWAGPTMTDPLGDIRTAMTLMPKSGPPIQFQVRTAAEQMRTACNVPLAWVRPKVPAKRQGRRGTRRAWKRKHPPHMTFTYAEPDDILVMSARAMAGTAEDWLWPTADVCLVTPAQMAALETKMGKPLR
jgi:hypothetical protein